MSATDVISALHEKNTELLAALRDLKTGADIMLKLPGGASRRYVEEVKRVCEVALKQATS